MMHNPRTIFACSLAFSTVLTLVSCGAGAAGTSNSALPPSTNIPSNAAPQVVNIATAPPVKSGATDCGAAWISSLQQLSKLSPSNSVDDVQIVSWNDYEHGSQIEAGVDNCVAITPAIAEDTLTWQVTGNTDTIDHYAVYSSTDGTTLTLVAKPPPNTNSLALGSLNLTTDTQYTMYVQAVGKPSVLNKLSSPASYRHNPKTAPVIQLTVSPASGVAPLAVDSSIATTSTIAASSIDFGDGTVVNATRSSHTYAAAGAFTVRAVVTNNAGLSSSATATVSVTAPKNQPPVAKLSVTPTSGTAPVTVSASTAGSSDPDGTIVSTKIDFGDGTIANAASASHTYATAGTYTVKATVTDNGGLSSSATAAISVTTPANQPPVARLSVTPTSGTAPVTVNASTAGSSDPDGTIVSTKIDFGDGTIANAASASHTYATAGTYTVKATVTDNGGLSSSATAAISVTTPANQPPVAKLSVTPTSGTAPVTVSASTAGSSDPDGTIVGTKIDFGDGTVLNSTSGSHTYAIAGTYTVTATVTDNGGFSSNATAGVAVSAPNQPPGWTTHGMTIPSAHPRLWWNTSRIAAAKTWLASHTYTAVGTVAGDHNFALDVAMKHVVSGSDCSEAVAWASTWAPPAGQVTTTANGSDDMRWNAELATVTFDWCYDQWTQAQRLTFVSNMNTWVGNVKQQAWGGFYNGTWMTQDNYFIGNLRNELEWGIVSYGESGQVTTADNFIDYALNTRWAHFVTDTQAGGAASGGVPLEGPGYGGVMGQYLILPVASVANMGRDLLAETPYYKEMAYWNIYWMTPASTYLKDYGGKSTFHFDSFNDDDYLSGGSLWSRAYFQDWMVYFAQHAAAHYSGTPIAGYTRAWLANLNPVAPLQYDAYSTGHNNYYVSNYIISNDPGGASVPYTSLPLDYWATGPQYGVSKSAWDTYSTSVAYFLGTPITNIIGHYHWDWGNFNMWRGGRWVMRSTAGYSATIAGTPRINSGVTQNTSSPFAYNVPVFTNVALGMDSNASYVMPTVHLSNASVNRMESKPEYFYTDTDLTSIYKWNSDHSSFDTGVVGHVEREFIYLRLLETLVVLDRVTTANQTHDGTATAASVITSFLTHYETNPTIEDANHYAATNGTQVLRQTVLIPASATYRVINEGGTVGQYRVEVDNSGSAQRYQLHVLQARDTSGGNLAASVVDSNAGDPATGTFTVTLHPSSGSDTTLVLNKGLTSSGGTINVAGAGVTNLTNSVMPIQYTDSGPVWGIAP